MTAKLGVLVGVGVLGVALVGCSGGGDPGEGEAAPAAQEQGGGGPVEAGGSFTYPDGLVVSVGNWREEATGDSEPAKVMRLDVTASNPTDEPITTTQAWVSVRAGDTGETLQEWAYGEALDAVLQPGAETVATYSYEVPESEGHVTATVTWLEATDAELRPDVEFIVEP